MSLTQGVRWRAPRAGAKLHQTWGRAGSCGCCREQSAGSGHRCDVRGAAQMSSTTPRFLAVVDGYTAMFSTVTSRAMWGQSFPGKRRSSVSLRLSFKWWVVVQVLTSARHSEMRFAIRMLSEEGKRGIAECRQCNSYRKKTCDVIKEPRDLVYRYW